MVSCSGVVEEAFIVDSKSLYHASVQSVCAKLALGQIQRGCDPHVHTKVDEANPFWGRVIS